MHIVYVITDLNVGGVPLHLHRLVSVMLDRGYRASVISMAKPGPVAEKLKADGVEVYSCEACCGWDIRVVRRLADLLRKLQPDIVHSFLFHANVASRWAARRVDIPANSVVCEIQTVEMERRWHLWVDRFTHGGCRFTIGNSPSVIQHLHTHAKIPQEQLRLVRGGIDPDKFQQVNPTDRSSLNIPSGAKMILWAGRLDPVKGLDNLLDAFHNVTRQTDAHLVLAGDGPLRSQLVNRVKTLSLNDRVHLLGLRDDVPSLMKAADLFVFPSRTEGLPNALLEAMASHCPIITTDVPGCRDLIEHDVNGLLVTYDDTKALADSITQLLEDRALAKKLAEKAAASVINDWHIDQTYNAYEAVYNEIATVDCS